MRRRNRWYRDVCEPAFGLYRHGMFHPGVRPRILDKQYHWASFLPEQNSIRSKYLPSRAAEILGASGSGQKGVLHVQMHCTACVKASAMRQPVFNDDGC